MASTTSVVISLDDIITGSEALKKVEDANKVRLETFDKDAMTTKLHAWVATGYQDSYPVVELPVYFSKKTLNGYGCSDGVSRSVWDFIPFCLGYPILDLVANTYQSKVSGFTLHFSVEETFTVIHFRLLAIKN
jgi:hypothetical protein